MAYQKINFQNEPSTLTPVSADNLNHMEDGIAEAHDLVASAQADIDNLNERSYAPVPVTLASEMTETGVNYLYLGSETGYDNGYLYYINSQGVLTRGSEYQAVQVVTDKTLEHEDEPADSKTVGDKIGELNSALTTILDEVTDDTSIDWSSFGTTTYPNGWRSGYYNSSDGSYVNSYSYIRTVSDVYFSSPYATILEVTAPSGYSVMAYEYNADGSFANKTYGSRTDTSIGGHFLISFEKGHKFKFSLGRFSSQADCEAHYADSSFTGSIVAKFYTLKAEEIDARLDKYVVEKYTKNLYNPAKNENVSIVDITIGNEQTTAESDTFVSQKIKIPVGQNVTFTGVRSYSLVDANNIVTKRKDFIETTSSVTLVWNNLPVGTQYVWLCVYKADATTITQLEVGNASTTYVHYEFGLQVEGDDIPFAYQSDIARIEASQTDYLIGKKYVAAGDSYTAWSDAVYIDGDYAGLTVTYDREIRIAHMMIGANAGYSGSTMALGKNSLPVEDKEQIDRIAFSNTRYQNIPVDTDILTIAFGINDTANCDLGSLGDTTNETFYGAWDVVLKYYHQYMPNMKIGIIVFQRHDNDFYRAVLEIGKYYGIPILDFYGGEDTPIYVDGKAYSVSTDIKNMRKNYYGGHAHESADTETFQGKTVRYKVSESANAGHPGFRAHIDEANIIAEFLKRL